MPYQIEYMDLLSLVMASVVGFLIGFERELSGKAAGLRTNVLISLGAALFTIISFHVGVLEDASPGRIAAQIVSGVGFLGAGAIIQDRGGVHGLTTAATIWLVASLGMACGFRFYLLAAVATLLALGVLLGLPVVVKWINSNPAKLAESSKADDQRSGNVDN